MKTDITKMAVLVDICGEPFFQELDGTFVFTEKELTKLIKHLKVNK